MYPGGPVLVPFKPLVDCVGLKQAGRLQNDRVFLDYFYRLQNLAISMFEWKNLPPTVSERFLELTLFEYGKAIYFRDIVIGDLALTVMYNGDIDVYRIPTRRTAYANNGYQMPLTADDSVFIFNNYLHMPSIYTIILYAERLTQIERAIEVNINAQKTPVLILSEESQRLTLEKVYQQYSGNQPVIFGSKNLDISGITAVKTDAPFVADKLYILKRQTWNEILTFMGIENSNTEKKERLVTDEISSNLGAVQAQRFVMLNSRQQAAKEINAMFGTNIQVEFRELSMISATEGLDETDEDKEANGENG